MKPAATGVPGLLVWSPRDPPPAHTHLQGRSSPRPRRSLPSAAAGGHSSPGRAGAAAGAERGCRRALPLSYRGSPARARTPSSPASPRYLAAAIFRLPLQQQLQRVMSPAAPAKSRRRRARSLLPPSGGTATGTLLLLLFFLLPPAPRPAVPARLPCGAPPPAPRPSRRCPRALSPPRCSLAAAARARRGSPGVTVSAAAVAESRPESHPATPSRPPPPPPPRRRLPPSRQLQQRRAGGDARPAAGGRGCPALPGPPPLAADPRTHRGSRALEP